MTDLNLFITMTQRAKAREAIATLHSISEYFNDRDSRGAHDNDGLRQWQAGVDQFEEWVFGESPIA